MKPLNWLLKIGLSTLLCIFCALLCLAEDQVYMNKVNAMVSNLDSISSTCDSVVFVNEQFLTVTTDGGGELTILIATIT